MVDLHLHSLYSDGELTIPQLVKELNKNNVDYAALTDHDSILGVNEFKEECTKYDIKTIPGVELEGFYDDFNYLHILCYNYKNENEMLKFLNEERASRINGILEGIDKLKKRGINVNFDEVLAMSIGEHLLINHLCMLLEKKGFVNSRFDAFKSFMDKNSPLFLESYPKITDIEVMNEIEKVGGMAVIAHPMRIKMNNVEKEKYILKLVRNGLKGIETYYSFNSEADTQFSMYIAKKYGLIETVGSDWHYFEENIPFGNQQITKDKEKKLKKVLFYE